MNGSLGYSKEALRRLETGTYRGRQQKYRTSQDQVKAVPKPVPALEGMTRSPSFDQTGHVDTANARARYEQRTNYKPIGRGLDQKDADTLYKLFDRNRLSSGGNSAIVHQLKNNIWNNASDWESKYGRSIEQIVDDYSKDFDKIAERKNIERGQNNKVSTTFGNIIRGATVEPALDFESTLLGQFAPDSNLTKAVRNATEKYSKQKAQQKSGVTAKMSDTGKGAYEVATNLAEKGLSYLNPSAAKYLLTYGKTAENKRQQLKERGIEGKLAEVQSGLTGLADAALDYAGFETFPMLKGLRESGNIGKMLAGGAAVGAGEQGLTSLIDLATDRIFNRDQSINAENVRNYMAQGLSEDEAKQQAFWDDVKQVAIETGSGAAFGTLMQLPRAAKVGLDNFARRYYADHYIIDPDDPILNDTVDTSDLNEYAQDLISQNSVPMLTDGRSNTAISGQRYAALPERQLPAIQLPGTNGTIELPDLTGQSTPTVRNRVKTVAESAPRNPRIVKPLAGNALKQAKADKADLDKQIKALNNTIKIQEDVAKNGKNKAIRKAETNKLNAMKSDLAELKKQKTVIDRQIKGQPTPIMELLTPEEADRVNKFKAEVRKVGNMWAGSKGKEQAKRVNDALDKYIETGNQEDLREYAMELIQLQNSATETYTSKAGNESRYSDYNDEYDLFDAGTSGLDPIFARSKELNGIGLEPEVAATGAPTSNIDVPHQIAARYANSFQDFDTYDYMDNVQEMDGIIERMAEDISTGKDLTPYIEALEENMYNAPDERVAGEMQALIDELTALQNGSENTLSSAERAMLLEGIPSGEPVPDDVYYEGSGVRAMREENAPIMVNPDSITDPNRPVSLGVVHDSKGRERYFVQEKTSDSGTRPVEPGKTYGSEDEARQALLRTEKNANRVPEVENTEAQAPNTSYWLRVLGDDAYAVREAQNAGVDVETLRGYAYSNLGYDVPPGNNVPNLDGMMPGDNMKTSQTYTNTGKNAEGWTEEEYNKYTDPSQFQYESIDEEESVRRATDMRQREGREGFKERMMNANKASGAEIDGLMMEWRELGEEARALEAAGQDASDIWHESVRVFRKIQQLSTESAQGLQALAKWSRNTPEGMLAEAENIVNGKANTDKTKLKEQLDKLTHNRKKVEFEDDFVIDFLKEAEKLEGLNPDSIEANEIMARLGKMVNSQIPARFGEKLTAFLMDNMLGNFRTLITRNAGGNVGLNLAEQLVQRPLAAGIDSLLSIKTGQRTQAGLTKSGLLEYIQGFSKGIKDEARDYKTGLHTARSGENTLGRAISANRHVFKNKVMDRLDNLVKQGLSIGDRPFYEAVYKQTLGDYNRLRERGLMGDDLQNMDDTDFDTYSKAAAQLNALGAVYQQDTMLSKALMGFKNNVGDLSKGILGVDILSQFSMPFVKTPANVIERAVDYSPLGAIRNAFRTGKEIKNDSFDQNRFANESARNILGTLLMAGGAGLAANGVLSGGFSDDADEKNAQRESGMQEYALNMGDKQMDISWVPVVGSNSVAAAAAYDAAKNSEGNLFENLETGLKAGGEALFDQSMFQGLQRLFGTGEAYNTDEGIVGNMANVVKSGSGQIIPSLVRQIGQVIDPYQRDLAYSNEGKSFGFFGNYDLNTLANNIPFLRENVLAPKVSTSGELQKENQGRNVASKILEDMILPGKLTKVNYTELNKEAARLKEATTSADAYMPKAVRKNVDTDEHTLTNKEWTEYQQRYYKELTDVGNKILNSDFYTNADATTQVATLKGAYDAVKYAINHEYNGKDVDGASKD